MSGSGRQHRHRHKFKNLHQHAHHVLRHHLNHEHARFHKQIETLLQKHKKLHGEYSEHSDVKKAVLEVAHHVLKHLAGHQSEKIDEGHVAAAVAEHPEHAAEKVEGLYLTVEFL